MARDVSFTWHGREITKSGWCEVSGKLYQVTVPESEYLAWRGGTLIHRAMKSLSNEEREFFISGTTPDEWRMMFGEEEVQAGWLGEVWVRGKLED